MFQVERLLKVVTPVNSEGPLKLGVSHLKILDFLIFKFWTKNAAKPNRQHVRIIFNRKSSSTEGCLLAKVVFTEGHLPPKVFFC